MSGERPGQPSVTLPRPSSAAGDLPGAAGEQAAAVASARLLRVWYVALLSVVTPVLVLGFLYSALADRLVFVGWGLAVALAYTVALRQGLSWGWPRIRLAGLLALLLAVSFAWLATLEATHHEILDLGFRAVFPALYHPLATRPASAGGLAAAFAVAGLGAVALSVAKRSAARR
jgi:hypothetical protein